MGDEKLPEYVEAVLEVLRGFTISGLESGDDLKYEAAVAHANGVVASARLAIHRYAREREAAALERAAKVCADEPECPGEMPDDMYSAMQTDREVAAEAIRVGIRLTKSGIASRIRALIQKEPANG